MEVVFLALTGIIVGFLTSLLGIGGGVVIIPMLYLLFPELPGPIVIATSLGIVCVTSTINSFYYFRQKKLPPRRFLIETAIPMVIGIYLGKEIMLSLDTKILKIIFGIFLIFISIKTAMEVKQSDHSDAPIKPIKRNIFIKSIGYIAAGVLSGLTGLGGGVVLIPLFKYFDGIPLKRIPAHTLPVVSIVALAAIADLMGTTALVAFGIPEYLKPFQIGLVNVGIVAIICLFAAITSRVGQHFIENIPLNVLKISLSLLLFITSIKMLFW